MVSARKATLSALAFSLACAGFICTPAPVFAAEGEASQPQKVKVSVKDATLDQTPAPIALSATVKSTAPTHKKVRSLDKAGQLYLSLRDLVGLFDFAIDFSAAGASGFFLQPKNVFDLRLDEKRLTLRSESRTLGPTQAITFGGELYISSAALLDWFDISALVEREKSSIHFSTPILLPSEARALRARKRQTLKPPTPQPSANLQEISGAAGAGYEVELYQNNALLAFQQADENGRFRFSDIPVSDNGETFKIVLYGPRGEYEERAHTAPAKAVTPPPPPPAPEQKIAKRAQTAMVVATANQEPTILPQNWKSYAVVRGDETTGTIEAYVGARGVFVRLDAFARALDLSVAQQTSSDVIDLVAAANHHIHLDIAQHKAVSQGQHYTLGDNDAFKNEEKIFVHESFLHRLFDHVPFTINQSTGKIKLPAPEKKSEPARQPQPVSETEKKEVAPTPAAAPVEPVIIDDIENQQRAAALHKEVTPESFEAHDVLHIEQAKPSQTEPPTDAPKETLAFGEPLILQPRLKKNAPSAEFIEALDFGKTVYLPLKDLVHYFEFPIQVDGAKQKASGYFFTSNDGFVLDAAAKEVTIGTSRVAVGEGDMRLHQGEMYISLQAITNWFGISCTLNREQSSVLFETDRLFPKEEQERRQQRWAQLLHLTEKSGDNFPLLQNDYAPIGYPSLDISLSSLYSHASSSSSGTKQNESSGGYNIQGAQELGYLTSHFYAQGSSTSKTIESLRFVAGRKDSSPSLLGPMKATEFAIGDVGSPSLSFVTSNSMGRGATITNRDQASSENFDVRSFTGDSVPGYEVELYRNNVLLAFQPVDQNGRYNFKDIPILYGENTFRLVFYGPQGQREERVETVSAASALLKEGAFEYTLGAIQRGFSLLPVTKNAADREEVPNGAQYVAGFRYGVTSNYSIGAAAAETLLADGPHRYLTTSSGANLFGVLSETSFARDMKTGGWASGMSLLGGIEDVSLRGRYRTFKDFVSESVNTLEAPRTSVANIDANSQLYVPLLQEFSAGLGAQRETFVDEERVPRYTYGARLSKSLWGFSLSNSLDYVIDSEKRIQDIFGIQTRLWGINFRANGVYDLKPVQQFRTASFVADYRLIERLSGQTQIERDLASGRTSVDQNLNWDFDTFRLSMNSMGTTDGAYSVGLNILFSLQHDEVANQWRMQRQASTSGGAIAGRVFIDENNNGVYDVGEKLVPDATVRVNRAAVKLDENGYFASAVTPYQKSRVEVSAEHLEDPLLTPRTKGYHVITRPGDTVVADFPLVHTTIIDGTAYFNDTSGEKRELKSVVIELQDAQGKPVRRVISEIDGYYSFDKVPSGDYFITVLAEVADSLNLTLPAPIKVSIAEVKEFVTGMDLVLQQKEKLNGPPVFETPTPALPAMPTAPAPTPPTIPATVREERAARKEGEEETPPEPAARKDEENSAGQVNLTP